MGVRVKEWKGAWWVFINHKGRRKAKRCASKKAAQLAADKIDAALKLGHLGILTHQTPTAPTFSALAEEWLDRYPVLRSVSPNTMDNYRAFTRHHLIPHFGKLPVTEVTYKTIEGFIAQKRSPQGSQRFTGKPLSESSLRVGLVALRLILDRAVKAGTIPANPAVGVARFGRREEDSVDPFTSEELRAILTAAEQINLTFATFLRLWVQSGMRLGEISALQNQDIDLEKGHAVVRRTWSRQRIGPPKTRRSRVGSFLHPIAEKTMEWRPGVTRDSRRVVGMLRGLPVRSIQPMAYVFGVERPWETSYVHAQWRRVLRAAGVRYRNPEQVRHAFASSLLSRNAPLIYVQQQGGWQSAAVLLRVYARWLPQWLPDATPAQPPASGDSELPVGLTLRPAAGTSRSS